MRYDKAVKLGGKKNMMTYGEATTFSLLSPQEVVVMRFQEMAGLMRVTRNFGMLNSCPLPLSSNKSNNLVNGSYMPGSVISTSLREDKSLTKVYTSRDQQSQFSLQGHSNIRVHNHFTDPKSRETRVRE